MLPGFQVIDHSRLLHSVRLIIGRQLRSRFEFGETFRDVWMIAEIAELISVSGQAGAEMRLFVGSERIEGIGDETKSVNVVGCELVAGPIFLMPFSVQAQQFGKNQG